MPRLSKTRPSPAGAGSCGPVLDLSSHIATKVAVFANRLSRSASRFYRTKYGIGVVEWRLMMFIGCTGETRANCICGATELDKGAVSRSLAALQRMGFVSVKEDGADCRRNNVALTAKGRALHDEMVPVALDRLSDLVSDLTQAEVETFTRLIDRLQSKVTDGEPVSEEPLPKRRPLARPRLERTLHRDEVARRRALGRSR
jgi:DNA-binding MarR family transcriptional regulator